MTDAGPKPASPLPHTIAWLKADGYPIKGARGQLALAALAELTAVLKPWAATHGDEYPAAMARVRELTAEVERLRELNLLGVRKLSDANNSGNEFEGEAVVLKTTLRAILECADAEPGECPAVGAIRAVLRQCEGNQ